MHFLRRVPACFALLLLGAHFLRAEAPVLTGLALALLVPVFAFGRRGRTVAGWALALGSLVWAGTLVEDVQARLALGAPWMRLAAILGAVAVFTAWAAWLLRPWPLRESR